MTGIEAGFIACLDGNVFIGLVALYQGKFSCEELSLAVIGDVGTADFADISVVVILGGDINDIGAAAAGDLYGHLDIVVAIQTEGEYVQDPSESSSSREIHLDIVCRGSGLIVSGLELLDVGLVAGGVIDPDGMIVAVGVPYEDLIVSALGIICDVRLGSRVGIDIEFRRVDTALGIRGLDVDLYSRVGPA